MESLHTSLIYNAKVEERSEFTMCLHSQYNDELLIPATWLQYAYQIYGGVEGSQ